MKRSTMSIVTLMLIMLSTNCVISAEEKPAEVLLVYNQYGETPQGAWVSGVHGCDAKRDKEENVIFASLTKEKQKLRIAFNGHQPWNATELKDGSAFKPYLRVQSPEDFTGKIQWGWYDKNKKTSSPSAYVPITLKAGEWADVYLPIASIAEVEDGTVTGIYINTQEPVTIKLQHIAIVAKQ